MSRICVSSGIRATADQVMAALQKQPNIPHGACVDFIGRQTLNAGAQAAMNVELKARLGVVSGQVHFARRNQEMPVDETGELLPLIGRRKKFIILPMSEDEAVEQMRLLGHDNFFVFFNAEQNARVVANAER